MEAKSSITTNQMDSPSATHNLSALIAVAEQQGHLQTIQNESKNRHVSNQSGHNTEESGSGNESSSSIGPSFAASGSDGTENSRKRKAKKKDISDRESDTTSGSSSSESSASSKAEEVGLDRSVLLQMSSTAFEEYATTLGHQRSLSVGEQKQIKAQRRLISNRESAQASRRRKKAYVEELETKVSDLNVKLIDVTGKVSQLQASNATLSAQVTELSSENASLTNQLAVEKS
eukprot:TRINITY_DN10449_c0_g1_i1.p1 TRINITY_DN10449_c0_g1~~TRINITY_DN10449_c0_g1_i1.p1  ORF type:complete len:232 (-),score=40.88 TRINITY_DN10449_c0_g1_i1:159-854(-)